MVFSLPWLILAMQIPTLKITEVTSIMRHSQHKTPDGSIGKSSVSCISNPIPSNCSMYLSKIQKISKAWVSQIHHPSSVKRQLVRSEFRSFSSVNGTVLHGFAKWMTRVFSEISRECANSVIYDIVLPISQQQNIGSRASLGFALADFKAQHRRSVDPNSRLAKVAKEELLSNPSQMPLPRNYPTRPYTSLAKVQAWSLDCLRTPLPLLRHSSQAPDKLRSSSLSSLEACHRYFEHDAVTSWFDITSTSFSLNQLSHGQSTSRTCL